MYVTVFFILFETSRLSFVTTGKPFSVLGTFCIQWIVIYVDGDNGFMITVIDRQLPLVNNNLYSSELADTYKSRIQAPLSAIHLDLHTPVSV